MNELALLGNNIHSHKNYSMAIKEIEKLSESEEKALAIDLYENNNLNAAKKLIYHHLYLVLNSVYKYRGYNLSDEDLTQEGTIGLMKAVKSFNPFKGVRLSFYATHWIEAEIKEFIFTKWKMIKGATTKTFKKLFFHYRKDIAEIAKNNPELSLKERQEQLALKLGTTLEDVVEMDGFMNGTIQGLVDEENNTLEIPVNGFEDVEKTEEQIDSNIKLKNALSVLNPREKAIVLDRKVNELSLKQVSEKHQISLERVRQIENQAMQKLKSAIFQQND